MLLPEPSFDKKADFAAITRVIRNLEATDIRPTDSELFDLQENLYRYDSLYSEEAGASYYKILELIAIYFLFTANDSDANTFLEYALNAKPENRAFVSDWANRWLQKRTLKEINALPVSNYVEEAPAVPEKRKSRKGWYIVSAIGVFIILGIVSKPISDHFVISGAAPDIKSLVEQSGMTRYAELIFLRANPQIVSSEEMASDCQDKSSAGQFVEQGCFIHDSNGGDHIYIRRMDDSRLYPIEIVSAAHEMLHAAYATLSSNDSAQLNRQLEDEYNTLADDSLKSRMSEYALLEPGSQDNELHSIIGTEYSLLPTNLESYYSKYFTDSSLAPSANDSVNQTFKDLAAELSSSEATISADENTADSLYGSSVNAANAGDAYNDDYYYNRYKAEFDNIQSLITQYNALADEYNNLTAEFNGKPLPAIQQYHQP